MRKFKNFFSVQADYVNFDMIVGFSFFKGLNPKKISVAVMKVQGPFEKCTTFSTKERGFEVTPWLQDVNGAYIRHSEDVLEVLLTSYIRSIYVLCLQGSC